MKKPAALALLLAFSVGLPAFAAAPALQGDGASPPKRGGDDLLAGIAETTKPQRLVRARKLVTDKLAESQIEEPTRLSVRNAWIDEHTYLEFDNAIVDPNANLATVPGTHAVWNSIKGTFLSAPGRTYMIDCTVGGSKMLYAGVTSTDPTASGATPPKKVHDGDYKIDAGHLYFVIAPQGRRQITFEIYNHHDGVDWALRRCEITPIAT